MTDAEPTPEQQLRRLWAAHEIRQLAYRYALAFDTRDRELFLSLWAPNDPPASLPEIDGGIAARYVDRFFDAGPSVMLVGNHLIDFEGDDRATGKVYGWPQVEIGGELIDQMVLYEDRYVRHEGRWLFEVRRHLLFYGQARDRNPFAQPPADWPKGQVGRGSLPDDFR